jgi:hypothetical protein
MAIQLKLQSLRTSLRRNSKPIIDNIIENHIQRNKKPNVRSKICMFCSSTTNVTKEHVLPRWVFEKDPDKFFVTDVNGLGQTYNRTTIPACVNCNSDILNSLETFVSQLLDGIDVKKTPFSIEESENIIRWLEIIDYKFQILDVVRVFKTSKQAGHIPFLSDYPISVLRASMDYSPSKVIAEMRRSHKRITTKNKNQNINSLVTFKTSNKGFNFFHQMNDFIFLELPKKHVAFFYFYHKTFANEIIAHKEAMKIIKQFYN